MNSKNFLTKVLLCVLAIIAVFSFAGCGEEPGSEISKSYLYDKQYENKRYYFTQGYPNDWKVSEGNDGIFLVDIEHPIFQDMGLVSQFAKDNAKYSVYCLKYNFMTASLNDYVMGLLGKDAQYGFEFNKYFFDDKEYTPSDDGGREAFVWDDTIESKADLEDKTVAHENTGYQFCQLTYTFTVDGVDWKGTMNVVGAKEGFYIITAEAAANVWDAEFKTMSNMLGDFHITGWETKE